jgi:hypothetical protein
MTKWMRPSCLLLAGALALGLAVPARGAPFPEARIYIEYNSTDDDLGFHVSLDAEDWRMVSITNPGGNTIFSVQGLGAFGTLGLTELFFEGAEPPLDEVPLETLLRMMPEGKYTFRGVTVEGTALLSKPTLSHAVPAGPRVMALVNGDSVVIRWEPVTGPPAGFPNRAITIAGYQVIVGSFQLTLPASSTSVTVPLEFTRALARGEHEYEVLAIEANGNQTITSDTFELD